MHMCNKLSDVFCCSIDFAELNKKKGEAEMCFYFQSAATVMT